MTALGTMDIFKILPAAKKTENANCKKCGCAGCMMFAVKLSKGETDVALCPFAPEELVQKLSHSRKIQQETVVIKGSKKDLTVGGEKVMFRHEKTFINPPPLLVVLDFEAPDFEETLKRLSDYKIENIGEEFTIEGVLLKNYSKEAEEKINNTGLNFIPNDALNTLEEVADDNFQETLCSLISIRKKAIVERDRAFSKPVFIHLKDENIETLCAKASAYICKYASCLLFDKFDEALFTTLYILRQNIYTDPEMPLQVESKVYEFNNPNEDAYVFLTTNFALSYFAVANEISNLPKGSYLVITPSEGMSVLTAWSAQKITAEIASKVVSANSVLNKVKNKKIIIPGLLADLKEELEAALTGWEVIPGTIEAYKIPEFVKKLG
ncbi:MAG: hypothetical protein OSJ27_05370 [Candidatus Gastranaerophilales bacterium]|nr:hypothetical protein [Candidatus Gastranaerophilales bacterium]